MKIPAFISVITGHASKVFTKSWRIEDGIPKKVKAEPVCEGTVERINASSPEQLKTTLVGLKAHQLLAFGLPTEGVSHITTKAKAAARTFGPETVARSRENFEWFPGPGWMLFDYDPAPQSLPLTREEWMSALASAAPGLAEAPMVWGTSSSSCIENAATGEVVSGIQGQRLYVLVCSAPDIPRAGKALFGRLWLKMHGYFLVSKSGALLPRTVVDASVWQPERVDYAATAVCDHPLVCRRPDPMVFNNTAKPVDLAKVIPDLSPEERRQIAEIEKSLAGHPMLTSTRAQAREIWVNDRLKNIPESAVEVMRHTLLDAVERKILLGSFMLTDSNGLSVTVTEILGDPDKWHSKRFHDPLEPDYGGCDARIAWANLKGGSAPYIYSHAHGGINYKLATPKEGIILSDSEIPSLVRKILNRLKLEGQIFERAGVLVRVADDELCNVEESWLTNHLEGLFQFTKLNSVSGKLKFSQCPLNIAQRIIASRGDWDLPKIKGIVTFPVMRCDGTVLSDPGFDARTGLLFLEGKFDRRPSNALTAPALKEALQRLWNPFRLFPFNDDVSRGVFLAALLTTAVRATLPTAPAFLIRANSPGSGKTLLSECLMLLVGARPTAMPMPENSEEVEKRLFAKLMSGCAGLTLDNITNKIGGSALCAFLTSALPEGRILGKSQTRAVENRALMVMNGNNVTVSGDAFRRVLPVSLDAECESPEARLFPFNPKAVIYERVDDFRSDMLSVLMSFQKAGAPTVGESGLGSFNEWDSVVRQCVCWIIQEDLSPCPLADPLEVLHMNKQEDPERQKHIVFLESWRSVYTHRSLLVREVIQLINKPESTRSGAETKLTESIAELLPDRGPASGHLLAGWLRRHKGVIAGGLKVELGTITGREPGWRVISVDPSSNDDLI